MNRDIPREVRKRRIVKRVVVSGIAIAAVALFFAASIEWLRPSVKRRDLRTARVERGSVEATLSANGTMVPLVEQVVSSPVEARVTRIGRRAGDRVGPLVAEALHRTSRRRSAPFVKVNLGGISSTLFESEMFGHVRGAFTDARQDRRGRFETADGGTIFLDEIGELDPSSQVKLLRVLQDRTYEVLDSSRSRTVRGAGTEPGRAVPQAGEAWSRCGLS